MGKFSFIIPIYNCDTYLKKCVCDIETMALDQYEIILVNDGSTDNSGIICDELAEKNEKIITIHQKNAGVSAARNAGIEASSGEYVVFLDADDIIESAKLAKVCEVIENDKELDLVLFGLSFDYYRNGNCYRQETLCCEKKGRLEREEWCKEYYRFYMVNYLSPIWNKIFKRDIIASHHLRFSEKMFLYEDLDFVFRYMAHCNVIYSSDEVIYHYRQSEDEGNAKRRLKRIDSLLEFMKQIDKALDYMIAQTLRDESSVRLEMKKILESLYLVLIREKVTVSNIDEIKKICSEYAKWRKTSEVVELPFLSESDQNYSRKIEKQKVYSLWMQDKYIGIRHRVANQVKSLGIYQRYARRK